MSRLVVVALCAAFSLSACASTTQSVVSSRNYYEPVFVPDLSEGPH